VIPTFFVVTGNILGGYWALGNMVFSLVFMVLVDFAFSRHRSDQVAENEAIPTTILVFGAILHLISTASLLYGVANGNLFGKSIIWAAISTGLNSGLIGITSAHELIHRKNLVLKDLGILCLISCCYGHFYIEHRKGHHALVGTLEDPATARKGEMFYAFLLRTIPGQWLSAFRIERERIMRIKGSQIVQNFTINITVIQILLAGILLYLFGGDLVYAFVLQAFIAIVLLEFVNYIEHYGLVRNPKEKVGPNHAWQSDSVTSRFTLFELSRHSHHHMEAATPYHKLQHFEGSKQLPFGYYGMFYIALIPPLWFKVMNPRLSESK